MSGVFNRFIFNNAIFNTAEVESDVATGGKGDNDRERRSTFKPLGILHRPAKAPVVDIRLEESRADALEIAELLAREFSDETRELELESAPIEQMSLADVDAEIGRLLRKKLRTEDEELFMLVLMMAAAAATV